MIGRVVFVVFVLSLVIWYVIMCEGKLIVGLKRLIYDKFVVDGYDKWI